ncbi:TPA: hypothetical protein DIC40_03935 [Patescibacteria group bacterium]|nr:hypothetical protein [Candidatus Gracilibacteria bacterium]
MIPEIKNISLKIFRIENFRQACLKYLIVVFLIDDLLKNRNPVNNTPICSQKNDTQRLFSANHHFLKKTKELAYNITLVRQRKTAFLLKVKCLKST